MLFVFSAYLTMWMVPLMEKKIKEVFCWWFHMLQWVLSYWNIWKHLNIYDQSWFWSLCCNCFNFLWWLQLCVIRIQRFWKVVISLCGVSAFVIYFATFSGLYQNIITVFVVAAVADFAVELKVHYMVGSVP